ncbi:aspartate aminotransferase family protein [Pseudomonas purpurea]|uniref:pyridoxal phosphate-dependent decarboxylase family protein n=1 Tax=Pseudomonas purpurea TaxID=3136737 RepID=UPI0032637F05
MPLSHANRLDELTRGMTTADPAGAHIYRRLMGQAVDIASRWLETGTLFDGTQPAAQRKALSDLDVFPPQGVGDEQALADAASCFLDHALQVHHPLCIAHLHCPTTLASQLAEVLINVANQSLDSWDQSPSATFLEQHLVSALRAWTGYPDGDAGVFTSGGTQSNLMGLLLARDRYALLRWGVDVKEQGLPACAQGMVAVCSRQAHFSVQQSLSLLGLGKNAAIPVSCDRDGKMSVDDLKCTLARLASESRTPFVIVATAGTTDTGAIDPLDTLADIAQAHGLWLHVDAAWGGALLLSHRYRHRLHGLDRADSLTLDFHKQFFQTISCGAFLLRDAAHFELMRTHADYLNPPEDDRDGLPNLVTKSLQTTRRFDALKLWMSLRSIGTRQYAAMIDQCIDLAAEVAKVIDASAAFELVSCGQLTSVLLRVCTPLHAAEDRDALHRHIAQTLFEQGIANLGVTRHAGLITLKMTLLNPGTTGADINALLTSIASLAEGGLPAKS